MEQLQPTALDSEEATTTGTCAKGYYVNAFVGHCLATIVFLGQISSYQRDMGDHKLGQ